MASPDLPQCSAVEQMFIGALYNWDDEAVPLAIAYLGEESDCFYDHRHAILYDAIMEMYRNRDIIRPESLIVHLGLTKKLERAGGEAYVMSTLSASTTSIYLETYAKDILEHHRRRCLIRACKAAHSALYDTKAPLADITHTLESQVFKTAHSGPKSKPELIGPLAVEEKKRLESVRRGEAILGLRTGFKVLDDIMMPMRPADYIILAACTSVGKTTLACNIVNNVAKTGAGVLFFSMEMTKQAITNKLMGIEAGVDLVQSERTGYMSDYDRRNLDSAMRRIDGLKILVDDESGMTPTKLRTKARAAMAQNEIGLIVIDYLGRLSVKGLEHDQTTSMTVISGEIKDMAKELNIPVLALCQLSRKGAEEKPRLNHLRQSGSLEQDADIAILLSRCPNPDYVTAQVAKQRIGPTGETQMYFEKATQRFLDIDHHGDPVYPAEYQQEMEDELF